MYLYIYIYIFVCLYIYIYYTDAFCEIRVEGRGSENRSWGNSDLLKSPESGHTSRNGRGGLMSNLRT